MPKALQHEYPHVAGTTRTEVWFGAMRVVSAKRARVLRKRGVPLMPLHAVGKKWHASRGRMNERAYYEPTAPNGRARYAWFECKDDVDRRLQQRARECYNTHLRVCAGTIGRKYWLAERLHKQRARLAHSPR